MLASYETLALGAALLLAAILLGWVSQRANLPLLLVFLVVGMLAGEDGPGGIEFDDIGLSFLVGNLALAVILLDGGMRTRYAVFRVAFAPSDAGLTLEQYLRRALRKRPVQGDAVTLGRLRLTVRERDGDRITKVGLKLALVTPPS